MNPWEFVRRRAARCARWALLRSREFSSWSDLRAFVACETARAPVAKPVRLSVKSAGRGPLYCRPGHSDFRVLWDTFYFGFHLPPRKLERGPLIVDLGANVGYTARHFAQLYPYGRVVAVEMDAANAAIARLNLEPVADRCELVEAAICAHDGPVAYEGSSAHGLRIAPSTEPLSKCVRTAQGMRMETLFEQLAINTVDYLKMDIEGAEADVLRRPEPWMARVAAWKVEIHPPAQFSSLARVLTEAGFACRPDPLHPHGLIAERLDSGLGVDEQRAAG